MNTKSRPSRPLPLEVLEISELAPGNLSLSLTQSLGWSEFPEYAETLAAALDGRILSRAESPVDRVWRILIRGQEYWLAFQDDPYDVCLDARYPEASEQIEEIRESLLELRTQSLTIPQFLEFPVLAFGQDDSIQAFGSAEEMELGAHSAIWDVYWKDLSIVDAAGVPFQVRDAVLSTSRWFSYFVWRLNLRIRVKVTLLPGGEASLDQAKRRMFEWIERNPGRWKSMMPLVEWEKQIEAAEDVAALCELIRR